MHIQPHPPGACLQVNLTIGESLAMQIMLSTKPWCAVLACCYSSHGVHCLHAAAAVACMCRCTATDALERMLLSAAVPRLTAWLSICCGTAARAQPSAYSWYVSCVLGSDCSLFEVYAYGPTLRGQVGWPCCGCKVLNFQVVDGGLCCCSALSALGFDVP
jgi:hypothetical protein